MRTIRVWLLRVAGVFGKERQDRDLDAELQSHLQFQIEENLRSGMAPEEARRQALMKLGGLDQAKESCRDRRGLRWLDFLIQDVHFALRMLRKSPGFTAVAVLTLALGIGANTAIFSVVNGILLEPLPYANSSRLVTIGNLLKIHGVSLGRQGVSLPDIADIESQITAFERFAICQASFGARIRTDLMPDDVSSSQVSSDFFPMLGGHPIIGRPILPEDEEGGGKHVTVLSYQLWQEDFGGDANVLSRSLLVNDKPFEIIGVMPRGFDFALSNFNGKGLWQPILDDPKFSGRRDLRFYQSLGILKKGVTLKQASAELTVLSARLAAAYPQTDKDLDLVGDSPKSEVVQRVRAGLLILWGAVGFVLLIACVNVSALLVARAWTRQREIAIRKALGASRLRLVRQLLSESMVLISLLGAIFFGIAPALQASARRLSAGIRDGLIGSLASDGTRQRHIMRSALAVTEVALAAVLLLGAALMVRSFEKLMHVDVGFRTDHLLTMEAVSSDAVCSYKSPEQQCEAAKTGTLRRIQSLPGVKMAAISQGYALLGGGYTVNDLWVEGSPENEMVTQSSNVGPSLMYHVITPDYFDVLGLRIFAGRKFNEGDTTDSPAVAIVNQSFAAKFLSAAPLGKRFAVSKDKEGSPRWMQIVGIVSDDRDMSLQRGLEPLYYVPASQKGYFNVWDYIVRTAQDPMSLAPAIEKQIWSVDKDAPIQGIRTMDQTIATSLAEPRFQTALLASFGALGLLLAIVGIYGVMSYAVVQRTHEIGIRMALGAKASDVLRLIVGEGMKLAFFGIVGGLATAWGLTRFLRSLLFEIAPTDPTAFVGVSLLLLLVAVAACYIPARRAMRVDPMVALRHE